MQCKTIIKKRNVINFESLSRTSCASEVNLAARSLPTAGRREKSIISSNLEPFLSFRSFLHHSTDAIHHSHAKRRNGKNFNGRLGKFMMSCMFLWILIPAGDLKSNMWLFPQKKLESGNQKLWSRDRRKNFAFLLAFFFSIPFVQSWKNKAVNWNKHSHAPQCGLVYKSELTTAI